MPIPKPGLQFCIMLYVRTSHEANAGGNKNDTHEYQFFD